MTVFDVGIVIGIGWIYLHCLATLLLAVLLGIATARLRQGRAAPRWVIQVGMKLIWIVVEMATLNWIACVIMSGCSAATGRYLSAILWFALGLWWWHITRKDDRWKKRLQRLGEKVVVNQDNRLVVVPIK